MKVEVVAHEPKWRGKFDDESKRVALILGKNVVAIHHIGSTAIPDIYAKPIIDLLVEVENIAKVDDCSLGMEALGYKGDAENP